MMPGSRLCGELITLGHERSARPRIDLLTSRKFVKSIHKHPDDR